MRLVRSRCCARAASGHAAIALPSSDMNSRPFDHLVGGDEQRLRHVEAEHPRSRGVDDQLELARLHHGQVRGLGALENAAGIGASLTIGIPQARSIAHQPASFGILAQTRRRGDPVERRQKGQLDTSGGERRAGADEESVGPFARKRCEGRIDLAAIAGFEDPDLQF
jgi:hypothetical protein